MTLYFSEELDEDSVGGYFRVSLWDSSGFRGRGEYTAAGEVEIRGNTVVVGLGKGRRVGADLRVWAYYVKFNDPTIARLRDLAGNEVRTPQIWTEGRPGTRYMELDNLTSHNADGAALSLRRVALASTTVSLTFSEALDAYSVPPASAFTVKKTPQWGDQETVGLSGLPVIAGTTVILTLANPVLNTDMDVKVSYTMPASGADNRLRDKAGNEAASFTDQTDTTQPRLVRGEIDGSTMTLYFNEELDEHSVGGYFQVTLKTAESVWDAFTTDKEVKVSGNTVVVGLERGLYRASQRAWCTTPSIRTPPSRGSGTLPATRYGLQKHGPGGRAPDRLDWTTSPTEPHRYAGNYRLLGGDDNDILVGGEGDDAIYGGGGQDVLYFLVHGGFGSDTIEAPLGHRHLGQRSDYPMQETVGQFD